MQTIKCPQCNLVSFANAINCKRCGFLFQDVDLSVTQPTPNVAPTTFNAQSQPVNPHSFRPQTSTVASGYQNSYQSSRNPNAQNGSPKKRLAVFSLIFGILSFPMLNMMVFGLLSVVLGMILGTTGFIAGAVIALAIIPSGLVSGIVSLVRANKRPLEFGGKGFAIAGIVLSSFGLVTLPIIAAIAIPNLLAARKSANEGSAIASLKSIAFAQQKFSATASKCGELSELQANQSIPTDLAGGVKNGYVFTVIPTPTGCGIMAQPAVKEGVSASGERSFYYSVEEGILRATKNKNQVPDKNSEIVDVKGFPPPFYGSKYQPNTDFSEALKLDIKPYPTVDPHKINEQSRELIKRQGR